MSQHWYDLNGHMRYDADLKTARAEGLLPSVTTVDKVIANEGLEKWKVNQAIMSALTLPRKTGDIIETGNGEWKIFDGNPESDEDYIKRIKKDSMEQAKKAARLGNVLHKMAERYASNKPLFFHGKRDDVWKCFEPVKKWIDGHLFKDADFCEIVLVGDGYAGKADYSGLTFKREIGLDYLEYNSILADYKSTFIKPSDIKKDGTIKKAKIYDSYGRQLAALNKVANANIVMSVIISTNPDFTGVWIYEWSKDELERAWIQFESALKIYRSIKNL